MRPSFQIVSPHDGMGVFGCEFMDPHTLLTCGADNKGKKFDIRMGSWESEFSEFFLGHIAGIRDITCSPDRKYVLTCCEDGSSRVFRADDLKVRKGETLRK